MSHAPAPFGSDLRAALVAMVRKRVPESEVEDIVQSALAEAIESPNAPKESEALRRWIFGVAKHKVVDYHRRAGRETFDMPEVAGSPAPHAEADLLRWAERNIPGGDENQKTLDWMLREGEGEKLEAIAASEKMPAPRVRQRVSRLRRHLKDNWQREVALLAALGVIVTAVVLFVLKRNEPEPITHDPRVVDPRAEGVRKVALERCAASDWRACVDGLDEAKRLDPAGDSAPAVRRAREDAARALVPAPSASPSSEVPPLPTTAPPESSAAPQNDAPRPPSSAPFETKGVPTTEPTGKPPAPRTKAPTKPQSFSSDFDAPSPPVTGAPDPTAPPATKQAIPSFDSVGGSKSAGGKPGGPQGFAPSKKGGGGSISK